MPGTRRFTLLFILVIGSVGAGPFARDRAGDAWAAEPGGGGTPAGFTVEGRVALSSFMALGDAHLEKVADALHLLTLTDDVRSGRWERIRGPLAGAAEMIVPAVLWFALPNGDYWTVHQGRATGNLADRPYFARALAGKTVFAELVVSRSTNRNTAIVAVPVRGRGGGVTGVLGASVHLDSLGMRIREDMGGLDADLIFFAIDSSPMGVMHSDTSMIFTDPMQLGDEGMRKAFAEMLTRQEGVVTYTFRGRERTVIYRRSPVTGWWYALGRLQR